MNKLKIITLIGIVAALSSCTSTLPKYTASIGFLDYSIASSMYDVFLTESPSVSFDYDAVGSIVISEYSGTVTSEQVKEQYDELYGKVTTTVKKGEWVDASPQSMVLSVAKAVKELGGDGLINMEIEPITNDISVVGYRITGMAIKRK